MSEAFPTTAEASRLASAVLCPKQQDPQTDFRLGQRLAAALMATIVLAPAIGWVASGEIGVVHASRDVLVASFAAFLTALACPPRRDDSLLKNVLPAIPVVFMTLLAVSVFRDFWGGFGLWSDQLVTWLREAGWSVCLVAFVYWGSARASLEGEASEKRSGSVPRIPVRASERFTISLWWSIGAVVCAWLPTITLFRVLEFGFGWAPASGLENVTTIGLSVAAALVIFGLGMFGVLPGTRSRRL